LVRALVNECPFALAHGKQVEFSASQSDIVQSYWGRVEEPEEGENRMVGNRLFQVVESHSNELSINLARKLRTSERTPGYRAIPEEDLVKLGLQVYANLTDWLLTKTTSDIELQYSQLGEQRAKQGIALSQLIWALLMSKEQCGVCCNTSTLLTGFSSYTANANSP
jgi:hypothetical protein